jgi:branched-chain amino acid transport system permease protein
MNGPETTRALDTLRLRATRRFLLFFGPLLLLGAFCPSYELLTLNQHLLLAVNVLALNFCLGLGGQASLAQGAFCGIGAYASSLAHAAWPEGGLVIIPAAALLTFAIAWLLSLPIETLGEGFLAMATLGIGLIFTNLVLSFQSVTGGAEGMPVAYPLTLPGGLVLSGDRCYFFLFFGVLLIGCYGYEALRASRLGRALLACREDALAASACGVDRSRTRAMAFGLGAALSAVAGALYAQYSGFISPRLFDLELSLKTLLFLVIGGPGRLFVPLVAVLLLESLFTRLHFLGDAKVLFNGLLLAAALLLRPSLERSSLLGLFRSRSS